jgi:hypothetical protein
MPCSSIRKPLRVKNHLMRFMMLTTEGPNSECVSTTTGKHKEGKSEELVRKLKYRHLPAFLLLLSLKVKPQHCLVHHLRQQTHLLYFFLLRHSS